MARLTGRTGINIGGLVHQLIAVAVMLTIITGCAAKHNEWAPPAPDIRTATNAYLAGDGKSVMTVVDQAVVLAKGGTNTATCEEVLSALSATGDQYDFRLVAAGIPDPVLADLALSTATVMSDALIACLGEATPGTTGAATPAKPVDSVGLKEALAQLEQLNKLTAQRLKELQ